MVVGPEKVELNLGFVKQQVNQEDFVLVNRAASRLPDDAAKELKSHLYSDDGDHRSVLVFLGPLRRVFGAFWGCFSGPAFAFWNLRLA